MTVESYLGNVPILCPAAESPAGVHGWVAPIRLLSPHAGCLASAFVGVGSTSCP